MPKKRKTLPKNFRELIEATDIAALKAVFDTCELDAYDSAYSKNTALHFYKVPDDLVRWLVGQGADINAKDYYGKTPLHIQARSWCGNVELFLELGANINACDNSNNTPLHCAADGGNMISVRLLLSHGANILAEEKYYHQTPLAYALSRCNNSGIANMADIAEILLNAGTPITTEMREDVTRIGKEFEFHRQSFNKDYLPETDAGLKKLYELFDVEAVPQRRIHDGISPITVTATRWQEQHSELWDYLVPSNGKAASVQGEVIRITGRLSHEILDNGSCNWDAEYRKMVDALLIHFTEGNALSVSELAETKGLAAQIRPKGDGDSEPERLSELAVKWVLANPNPIPLNKPNYKR